jgi:serine/threonine-protein kinase
MTDALLRLSSALADRYVIERELGAGGMATVYLAHDVRHDRKVALKVLRPELSAILGAERFLHEIKTTANLQHPHILSLFDSGEADGLVYYVMPYVEGESLRDRLNREKQLPVEDAVRIAREVADALHYAHQQGVVHRDIKPENILLHGGHAMVADFGIALAASRSEGGTRMTETGMSLGTPYYMSPEQSMGEREITPKADIYALGCVLYEMLTAEPPFTGATAQAIIARVMTEEPRSLTLQRKSIPPHVEAAVERALEKLPADRWASAAEFGAALADASARTHGRTDARKQRAVVPSGRLAVLVPWALFALALAAAAWAVMRPQPPAMVGRYEVVLGGTAPIAYRGSAEPARLALTPDGRELVYPGRMDSGPLQLFVRPLGSFASRPIPGTAGAIMPVVSWDGAQVAYLTFNPPALRVASLRGGAPLTLVDSAFSGAPAWGPDGFVYFFRDSTIRRIPGGGGPVEDVVKLPAPAAGSRYRTLSILPGGRGVLVGEVPPTGDRYTLRAVDLKTGRFGATLEGLSAHYVAEARALVYVTPDGTLMAVGFDVKTLATRGRPVPMFDGVAVRGAASDLTLGGGTLAYALPGTNAAERMFWVDRAGGAMAPVDSAWHDPELEGFALSPDGSRLAITIASQEQGSNRDDIWIKQLDQGPLSRLTFGGESNTMPSWSGDGRWVSYTSRRNNRWNLWRRQADGVGTEELVADVGRDSREARWSRDGAWLVACVGGASFDIMVKHLGTDSTLRPLLAEAGYDEFEPSLSPDGRWLAYTSNETGTAQVFVRPFPDVQQGKWQISTDGGVDPVWSGDGRELFFRSSSGAVILSADMARGPAVAVRRVVSRAPAGTQFEVNGRDRMFEVSADGRRFLVDATMGGDRSGNLVIVQNFITELRAALAAGAVP